MLAKKVWPTRELPFPENAAFKKTLMGVFRTLPVFSSKNSHFRVEYEELPDWFALFC